MPPKVTERICVACKKPFIGKFKTCSKACVSKIISEGKIGSKNPNWKPRGRKCKVCNKFFIKIERRTVTCSPPCMKKLQSLNNGMRNPGVAKRVAQLRKEHGIIPFMKTARGRKIIAAIARHRALTNNPMKNPLIARKSADVKAEKSRQQYAEGRKVITYHYENYKKLNGKTVRLQSSYEVSLANWLDRKNINWFCHEENECPKISYFTRKEKRTYHPDFFVPHLSILIDTKGYYFLKKKSEEKKLIAVSKYLGKIKLIILTEKELDSIGIKTRKAVNVKNQKNYIQRLRKSCKGIKFGSDAVRELLR